MRTLTLACLLAAALPAADAPSDLNRVTVGQPAPDFRLKDGDGREHSLAERRGQPVIVVFYRGYW